MVQLSQLYVTTGNTIAFRIWTFVDRVMSLFFNTLSRFVIAFLPRSSHLIHDKQSLSAVILEPKKRKSVSASILPPSICNEIMGLDAMILVFLFSHKLALSFSSFTLIKRLFCSPLLSAIRVVSSEYLRLLTFLPPVLIPACNSSSQAFLMCSAYRLNKQGDSRLPCCIPFLISNQSVVPYRVLIVASWLTYRFLRRQVRCTGNPISLGAFHNLSSSRQSKALV